MMKFLNGTFLFVSLFGSSIAFDHMCMNDNAQIVEENFDTSWNGKSHNEDIDKKDVIDDILSLKYDNNGLATHLLAKSYGDKFVWLLQEGLNSKKLSAGDVLSILKFKVDDARPMAYWLVNKCFDDFSKFLVDWQNNIDMQNVLDMLKKFNKEDRLDVLKIGNNGTIALYIAHYYSNTLLEILDNVDYENVLEVLKLNNEKVARYLSTHVTDNFVEFLHKFNCEQILEILKLDNNKVARYLVTGATDKFIVLLDKFNYDESILLDIFKLKFESFTVIDPLHRKGYFCNNRKFSDESKKEINQLIGENIFQD